MHNFWWQGVAMMEAAATRGVHGGPGRRSAGVRRVEVLDHWDRVGDWTQQWLNLRYVVRLLARPHTEAVTLHHCLVAAAKPSLLDDGRLDRLLDGPDGPRAAAAARGTGLTEVRAVKLARARLRQLRWRGPAQPVKHS